MPGPWRPAAAVRLPRTLGLTQATARPEALSNLLSVFAWLTGASLASCGYWYLSAYVFGLVDHAYGRVASFQLGLLLSFFLVLIGFVGFVAVQVTRRQCLGWRPAFLSGLAFAFAVLLAGFIFGSLLPDRDHTVLAIGVALLLGGGSHLMFNKREA